MEFHRFTLSNGINVLVAPMVSSAPVSVQVWLPCGFRMETKHEVSISHLTEHMVFLRGGRDYPNARSVERLFRMIGGKGNAATSEEFVFYYLVTSPRNIRQAVHLLSDMVVHARIDPADLESERKRVFREMKFTLDDPEDFSERKFKRFIYGDNSLGWLDFELTEPLSRFTVEDVRRFKERFYGPPNMVISVAGGIPPFEVHELLEEYFGAMTQRERVKWLEFCPEANLPPTEILLRGDVSQAHLHIGGFAPSCKSQELRLSVLLHEVLSYRLWSRLVVGGGLYTAFAEPRTHTDAGNFLVYAGVDADAAAITEVMRVIFSEMADIKSGHISAEELEEARTLRHAVVDLGLEGVSMIASFLASYELNVGRAKTVEELHQEVDMVTKDGLIRLAQEIWKEESVRSLLLTNSFPRFEEKYCELRKVLR
ncbi:MAG: pitrilysin family protein [Candidatus Sungiibacteriota bacterium]